MPGLVDKLKRDHALIADAFVEARELGFHSSECHRHLLDVKGALIAHLRDEDELLYPSLRKAAETDEALRRTLDLFARDAQAVTQEALAFFDKYTVAGSGIDFAEDFGRLYALLAQRIRKEEDILYPEYDKLRA